MSPPKVTPASVPQPYLPYVDRKDVVEQVRFEVKRLEAAWTQGRNEHQDPTKLAKKLFAMWKELDVTPETVRSFCDALREGSGSADDARVADAFREMAGRGHDALVDDAGPSLSAWDEVEWEWR